MVEGDGKPLLFLHGFGSSKESFFYQTKFFAQYFKVYAPDLPGAKTPLKEAFSLKDYANIVKDFLDEITFFGKERANVIAHSFGARIVLKLAPDPCVDRLILTGAAGLKPKRNLNYYLKIWGYKSIKALFGEKVAKKFAKKTASSDYLSLDQIGRESFVKIVNEHLDKKLKDVTYPTLIIQGKKDQTTPLYMAKRFHKNVKGSVFAQIDGGHFAFLDNPNQFNLIAKEFLLL